MLAASGRNPRDYPGTLRTRPPELNARGVLPTQQSDVWMMAASILALLTGTYPFVTEAEITADPSRRLVRRRTKTRIHRGELPLHERVLSSVEPRWLALLICHSLRFEPAKRPTADELRKCLIGSHPAPHSLLSIWNTARNAANNASHQTDYESVDHSFRAIRRTVCGDTPLLQEHLLDAFNDGSRLLSERCYFALLTALGRGCLNWRGSTLQTLIRTGIPSARIWSALLYHLAAPARMSRRRLFAIFQENSSGFALTYNNHGSIHTKQITLAAFKVLVHEETERLEKIRATASSVPPDAPL